MCSVSELFRVGLSASGDECGKGLCMLGSFLFFQANVHQEKTQKTGQLYYTILKIYFTILKAMAFPFFWSRFFICRDLLTIRRACFSTFRSGSTWCCTSAPRRWSAAVGVSFELLDVLSLKCFCFGPSKGDLVDVFFLFIFFCLKMEIWRIWYFFGVYFFCGELFSK